MTFQIKKIDLIYTWVNGNDETFINKCKEVAKDIKDINPERFRDEFDMIKYSLRSVDQFAPWVNNIYFLTQEPQIPDWLDINHPRIKIVHHKDIIDPEFLPTYNIHVIESYLSKIEGLSEHFIYLNDDFLFGRETPLSKFISSSGVFNIFGSLFGENLSWRIYNKKNEIFGLGLVEHNPLLFRKDLFDSMFALWPEKTQKMREHKFRQDDDLHLNKLHRFYMLKYQPAITRKIKVFELKRWHIFHKLTNDLKAQEKSIKRLAKRRPFFYCLNDDMRNNPDPRVLKLARNYLSQTYPKPSQFEK